MLFPEIEASWNGSRCVGGVLKGLSANTLSTFKIASSYGDSSFYFFGGRRWKRRKLTESSACLLGNGLHGLNSSSAGRFNRTPVLFAGFASISSSLSSSAVPSSSSKCVLSWYLPRINLEYGLVLAWNHPWMEIGRGFLWRLASSDYSSLSETFTIVHWKFLRKDVGRAIVLAKKWTAACSSRWGHKLA